MGWLLKDCARAQLLHGDEVGPVVLAVCGGATAATERLTIRGLRVPYHGNYEVLCQQCLVRWVQRRVASTVIACERGSAGGWWCASPHRNGCIFFA